MTDKPLVDEDLWGNCLADVNVDLLASAKAFLSQNRREKKTETARDKEKDHHPSVKIKLVELRVMSIVR